MILYLIISLLIQILLTEGCFKSEPTIVEISKEYIIERTWDDSPLNHSIKFTFKAIKGGIYIEITAPFFNSPPKPNFDTDEPFNLWDYEVAEVFFLSDSGKYLELEFGPHGHYLVLLLDSVRHSVKKGFKLEYVATIMDNEWIGKTFIPDIYFPCKVTRFNAYSIHGNDDNRLYKALFPAPKEKYDSPDFHRLQYFQEIDFSILLPPNAECEEESDIWTI